MTGYPNIPAVYALHEGIEIVYIGVAKNLASRLKEHVKSGKTFSKVSVIFEPDEDQRLKIETALICLHQPRLNRAKNPKWRPWMSVMSPLPERFYRDRDAFIHRLKIQVRKIQGVNLLPGEWSKEEDDIYDWEYFYKDGRVDPL